MNNNSEKITTCTTEVRGDSTLITPPSGRSYWASVGEIEVFPCLTCHGEGHHDSCFDCGNRGYNDRTRWHEQISSALGADVVEPVEDAVVRGAIPYDPQKWNVGNR